MRAISLHQPYASAIALKLKRIETRGWDTKYRGPLAIHAAKRWSRNQIEFTTTEHALGRLPARVPLGAIVAVCELVDVQYTVDLETQVSAIERLYGDYEPGRFGWILDNVRALAEPIPYLGKQGFFSVPDELLRGVA